MVQNSTSPDSDRLNTKVYKPIHLGKNNFVTYTIYMSGMSCLTDGTWDIQTRNPQTLIQLVFGPLNFIVRI